MKQLKKEELKYECIQLTLQFFSIRSSIPLMGLRFNMTSISCYIS